MKANRVYFIEVLSDLEEDGNICEDLFNVIDESEIGYIGFTNNNDMFVRLISHKVIKLCNILKKYKVEFKVSDVTNQIINGDIQKKYPEVEKLTPNIFNEFRIENSDIDDILDKINEKGIESLDYIDKCILDGNILNGKMINENVSYTEKTHY